MKYKAGFVEVMCVCTAILWPSADAGRAPGTHAAAAPCRPKELMILTRSVVKESLAQFDEANGKHLGTWSPGFPELQVNKDSAVVKSKVQCSLIFMAQGLGKILQDQRSNLNPNDVSLHRKLEETRDRTDTLRNCLKSVLGGECSPKPPPPVMPQHTFERKQWSHTLLKAATFYLEWLERNLRVHVAQVTGTDQRKRAQPRHPLEGSGYLQ